MIKSKVFSHENVFEKQLLKVMNKSAEYWCRCTTKLLVSDFCHMLCPVTLLWLCERLYNHGQITQIIRQIALWWSEQMFSLLSPLIVMTTRGATSDKKVGIMSILCFQCFERFIWNKFLPDDISWHCVKYQNPLHKYHKHFSEMYLSQE